MVSRLEFLDTVEQYLNYKILQGGTLLQPLLNLSEDQARSQDFAKGGLFWKFGPTVNEVDPNFHYSEIGLRRFFTEK